MNFEEFCSLFRFAAEKNGILTLGQDKIEMFYEFTRYLLEVNQITNLTAIREEREIIYKHYIDSLLVEPLIPEGARVLDLGCGPGFPSIPLAIAREDVSVVALDSTAKKIDFVNKSTKTLQISNLKGEVGRAEDAKTRKNLGEFDIVVSRAVARLNVILELGVPYCKLGGRLIAMKGAKGKEELVEAKKALATLSSTLVDENKTVLHADDEESRYLIEIIKNKSTPACYPRSYAAILKKPL